MSVTVGGFVQRALSEIDLERSKAAELEGEC